MIRCNFETFIQQKNSSSIHKSAYDNKDLENTKEEVNPDSKNTITELTFIPNKVQDGFYFLNIQLPHFECDAAPSRPILIKSN